MCYLCLTTIPLDMVTGRPPKITIPKTNNPYSDQT